MNRIQQCFEIEEQEAISPEMRFVNLYYNSQVGDVHTLYAGNGEKLGRCALQHWGQWGLRRNGGEIIRVSRKFATLNEKHAYAYVWSMEQGGCFWVRATFSRHIDK